MGPLWVDNRWDLQQNFGPSAYTGMKDPSSNEVDSV